MGLNNNQIINQADFSRHQIGNYRLVRTLGNGSFAFVYLGEHIYLKRLAAIKVLRTVLTERGMERFLEEAKILANLSHPHIVRVLEFSVAQRQALHNSMQKEHIPFLVMEYASAGNLRNLYPAGTPLAVEKVISTMRQVVDALQYAHERNIIHRDIKPENLLVNERQEVMLSDFGLALFAPSPELLSRQGMAGTLAYTAPEQLQGKPSFASDQYSLGIIAYEWLCGSRPFQGEDVEIIMHQISSPPPRLRSKNPVISSAVEDVVLKALAKDPQKRYQNVQDFAQALERASLVPTRGFWPLQISEMLFPVQKKGFPEFHYFAQKAVAPMQPDERRTDFAHPTNLESKRENQLSSSTIRNRLRMIYKVRTFWIQGVLKQSLHGTSFIPLGLDGRQDVVASPWPSSRYQTEEKSQKIASGATISTIYDQAGGELLILGEAGSGKTTLLLELARHLLDRAEQDQAAPIPVILPLSSWSEKQLPLEEWFIEELYNKYQVPFLLGEQWVSSEMLLPLLDGLDEVAAPVRSNCVVAINTYKEAHGLSSLVVCSRLTEYLLFPPRVLLQSAIVVRPLTMAQIEKYLQNSMGGNFDVLYQAIHNDLILQALMTKPLMLHIMARACQGKSPKEIVELCLPDERYQRIFGLYVAQVLHRYQTLTSSSPQQLIHTLAYLALQMQQHNQTVFYLEQLQPDWIGARRWERLYRECAVLLPGAVIGALTGLLSNVLFFHAGSIDSIAIDSVYGIVIGYMLSSRQAKNPSLEPSLSPKRGKIPSFKGEYLKTALFVGLVTFLCIGSAKGWLAGLANGIILGGLSLPLSHFIQTNCEKRSYTRRTSHGEKRRAGPPVPREHLKNGVWVGLACGLTSVVTLLVNQAIPHNDFVFLLILGIRDSLCNALIGTLLSLLLIRNDGLIHRAEIVSWSWKRFWASVKNVKTIFYDAQLGIFVGVLFTSKAVAQGMMNTTISGGLSTAFLVVLSARMLHGLLSGISSKNIEDNYRSKPNEGIKRSLYHGWIGGLIGLFVIPLFSVLTSVIASLANNGLASFLSRNTWLAVSVGFSNALLLGPAGALLAGLLLGGLAFLQYTFLRFILWRTGNMPRKLFPLLEDATASILLHKVGGGYLFTHRFLLEYFASIQRDLIHHKT